MTADTVPQDLQVAAEAEAREQIRQRMRGFKEGDRVEIIEPQPQYVVECTDAPFLYGTVVKPVEERPGANFGVIEVLLDGLKTPTGFYSSQMQRNPVESPPHAMDFRRRPTLRKLRYWGHRRKVRKQNGARERENA